MTDAKTTTTELEKVQRMRMDSLSGMLVPAGTDWRNVGPKRWIRYEEAMVAAAHDQDAAVKAAVKAAYMESARLGKRIAELERELSGKAELIERLTRERDELREKLEEAEREAVVASVLRSRVRELSDEMEARAVIELQKEQAKR